MPIKTMQLNAHRLLSIGVLSFILCLGTHAAETSPGYVDFGKFSPPGQGGEFVEISLQSKLISMAAQLTQKDPAVAELLRGLKSVRVNVIGLNDENREEIEKRIQTVRSELGTKGWDRIVTAQKKNEDVGIFLKTRGEEAVEGLVVTVLQNKREAVFINIVGDIKPDKLAMLGEHLNIAPLGKVGRKIQKETAREPK